MRAGPHIPGRGRGAPPWHHGGYPYPYPSPYLYAYPSPWPVTVDQFFDPSMMVDQSQMLDPMFDPSQMVDLSQGLNLLRTRGIDLITLPEDDPSQPLPGPSIIGLYGMFTGDFRRAGDDAPPRRRGLLLLGRKQIKKAWNPRRLRGWR